MNTLWVFGRFELDRLVRSWKFLAVTVGFPVIFYMLFLGDHTPGKLIAGTVPWRVYLMVSMCSFGALVAGLNAGGTRLSGERATGWARQLRVTPLPGWSYVATKVTASMVVVLPVLILVEVVGAAFGGVSLPAATWVELTLLMWVTAVPLRHPRRLRRLHGPPRDGLSGHHRTDVRPRLLRRPVHPGQPDAVLPADRGPDPAELPPFVARVGAASTATPCRRGTG